MVVSAEEEAGTERETVGGAVLWALRREGVAKGVTVAAEVGAVSERAVVDASAEVVAVDGAMAGTSAPSPSSLWFCTRLPPPSHSPRLSPCPPVLSSLHSALPLHPWTARPPLRLLELGPSPGGGVVVSLRWRGGGARAARVFVRPSPPR